MNSVVRNEKGEIIAKIEGGKLSVYEGKERLFKEANENTPLPSNGLSEEEFISKNTAAQKEMRKALQNERNTKSELKTHASDSDASKPEPKPRPV
ncbi:MAG: hypothetical protein QM652_01000 [Legionella sp.]|uniref:hypothetical protein n=1 Tax=Legionella sp. TaxID=459 RepID=UPI0039E69768